MVQFRACPRCQGDLNVRRDMWGEYRQCLQCGFSQDIQPEPKMGFDWVKARGKPSSKQKMVKSAAGTHLYDATQGKKKAKATSKKK